MFIIVACHLNGTTKDRLVDFFLEEALNDFEDTCDPDLYLSSCLIDGETGNILRDWRTDRND